MSIDFFPTIVNAAGGKGGSLPVDGVDLTPLLKGEKDSLDREALYWHFPHSSNQGGFPGGAIRMGKWKLIERYEDGRTHLYDLETDIGERNDVAGEHPDLVQKMASKLHAWYGNVDAKFLQAKDGAEPWSP